MFENPIKRKLEANQVALCMAIRMARTVDVAMMIKSSGFDGFNVDMEHSSISGSDAAAICVAGLAVGLTPIVRVKSHAAHDISGALDGGALGVIIPHVNTAAEAEAVVSHAKYPPLGDRGVAAVGPMTFYRSEPLAGSLARRNRDTLVIVMCETQESIRNARAIAAVPGVDVLLTGAADLSAEMGIAGEQSNPRIREAHLAVADACIANGKHFCAGTEGDMLKEMLDRGARLVMGAMDQAYMMRAAAADARKIRDLIGS